jgi:hypothetical protein
MTFYWRKRRLIYKYLERPKNGIKISWLKLNLLRKLLVQIWRDSSLKLKTTILKNIYRKLRIRLITMTKIKTLIYILRSLKKWMKSFSMKIKKFKLDKVKESGKNYIRLLIALMYFVWYLMQEILWEQSVLMPRK